MPSPQMQERLKLNEIHDIKRKIDELADKAQDISDDDATIATAVTNIKTETAAIAAQANVLFTNLQRAPGDDVDYDKAPFPQSAVVENASPTIVEVTFNDNIAITDETGLTVNIDAGTGSITLASVTDNLLELTLGAAITAGQVVTVDYDADVGNIVYAGASAEPVESFTAFHVMNNVE